MPDGSQVLKLKPKGRARWRQGVPWAQKTAQVRYRKIATVNTTEQNTWAVLRLCQAIVGSLEDVKNMI
jgi:hypothetical protein